MAQPTPDKPNNTYRPPKTQPGSGSLMLRDMAELQQQQGGPLKPAPLFENKRSFWEDPRRVVQYRDMLRAAPPDFEAPPWLDRDALEAAYRYMQFRNNDAPSRQWRMLPDDDPGLQFLRGLPTPPPQFQPAYDRDWTSVSATPYTPPPDPFGDWDNLRTWQKIYLGAFSPQPGLQDRPEWTRYTAAAGQGALAIPGGAAVGALVGGPVGGVVGGGIAGVGTAYQALTGQRVPILGELLDVFNLLPMGAERVIGLGSQAQREGLDAILADLPNAWRAASLTYETAALDLLNAMAVLGGDTPAGAGEVWQIARGLSEPVALSGQRGAPALRDARLEIARLVQSGMTEAEAALQVYTEYTQRFGDSGTFNDFVLQTVIDPTNVLPWAGSRIGETAARGAGNLRMAEAFRTSRGNPLFDMIPFLGEPVARMFGTHTSAGPVAAIQTYRNWIQRGYFPAGIEPRAAGELSSFERAIGGLTETGAIRELQPTQPGTGVAGWLRYLNSLTPEAKAQSFVTLAHDNLNVLLGTSEGDPGKMVQVLKQAAGMTPTQAADAGRALIGSPVTATIAQGLRDALNEGWADALLLRYEAAGAQRAMLEKTAQALGEKPADVLEQYVQNPAALAERIRQKGGPLGTPEQLAQVFGLFTGEDPLPWNANEFQARLAVTVFDRMDDWLVTRYNLKPESAVFRLSKTLKGMQSLLLLGFNPAYFINNQVNNMVTRAAVGVFGYMTPRQIGSFLDRFGITPERLSDSLGADGRVHYAQAINEATNAGDWIAGVQRVVSDTAGKLGVFSRFSSMGEALESRNAYVIGMTKFWKRHWKPGRGFDRMRPDVEALLDRQYPGVKQAIYRAVQAGMNMGEIEAALMGQAARPRLEAVVERAARMVNPDDPERAAELLHATGVDARLSDLLKDAKTGEEVDAAFHQIGRELEGMIDQVFAEDLTARAEDAANRVRAEGWAGALELFNDVQVRIGVRWLKHFEQLEDLYARRGEMGREEFDAAIRAQDEADSAEWKRINEFERQSYAGIIRALGIESDPSRRFVDLLTDSHENWRRFFDGWDDANAIHHDGRRDLYKKFFATYRRGKGETWEQFRVRTEIPWRRLQEKLARMYAEAVAKENQVQGGMNEIFAALWTEAGGDGTKARAWRERVLRIRRTMQEEMTSFRRMIEDTRMDAEERRAAWSEFLERYNQLVIDLKKAEVEGANDLAGRPETTQAGARALEEAKPKRKGRKAVTETEEEVNRRLAEEERAAQAEVQAWQERRRRDDNMALALRYGIVDKAGRPIEKYLLNIVNKRQPEGRKFGRVEDIPAEVAEAALIDHRRTNAERYAEREARLREKVQEYLRVADEEKREARLRADGLMTRRHLREQLLNAGRPVAEVEAALVLLDHHADTMVKRAGREPGELGRAEWYATRIAKVLAEGGEGGLDGSLARLHGEINPGAVGANGAARFLDDGRAVIRAFEGANATTIVHEVGHIFRRDLAEADLDAAARHVGLSGGEEWKMLDAAFRGGKMADIDRRRYVAAEETFARNWERYLAEGDAPSASLKRVFQQFTDWMKAVYTRLIEVVRPWGAGLEGFEAQPEFTTGGARVLDLDRPMDGKTLRDIFDRTLVMEREAEYQRIAESAPAQDMDLTGPERAMLREPVRKLPAHVREAVQRIATRIRNELAPSGRIVNPFETVEGGAVVTEYKRGWDAPQWYKDMYIAEERAFGSDRAGTLKQRVMDQLDSIIRGTDTGRADIADTVKRMILDAAMGDFEHFPVNEPAIVRFLGDNEKLFREWSDQLLSAEEAQLRAWFGDEWSGVVDELLLWMSDNSAETTPEARAAVEPTPETQPEGAPAQEAEAPEAAAEAGPVDLFGEPTDPFTLEAQRAEAETFNPAEQGQQEALFDRGEYLRKIEPKKVEGEGLGEEPDGPQPWLFQQAPAGSTPTPQPIGSILDEIHSERMRPLLEAMRRDYRARLNEPVVKLADLDEGTNRAVRDYLRDVNGQLASTKFAAMSYGEQMRDSALLNYNRRYGLDNILDMVFPYQFWYTRSMIEWAKRMIDRPGWFAMYARLQEMQEKLAANMPERLRGRVRIPAPWLPEWAGGGLWVDPMSKFIPFATFADPMERYTRGLKQTELHALEVLDGMVDAGTITAGEARAAKRDREGPLWERALAQAGAEGSESGAPLNFVSMMMTPSLFLTTGQNLMRGTPEKIGPLPITRTAGALETATRGTALEGLGGLGSLLAWPERKARGAAGLNEFGEWGDYYIDRQLANMAAEGVISAKEAQRAMIEREGDLFEQARARVRYEQMLTVPGAALLNRMASGDVIGSLQALPALMFGGSLFPTGELKLRGLQGDFSAAFAARDRGDSDAVNRFFDENPEYEARLALNREPAERLRQFLVSEVWERYGELEGPNRTKVAREMGPLFEKAFLDKETRSYESIPVETLARWAGMLEGVLPHVPETQAVIDDPEAPLELYSGEQAAAIQAYQQERAERFPNYYAVQQSYFAIPEGERAARRRFLQRFPELKEYWDWKRGMEETSPLLGEYFEDGRRAAQMENAGIPGPALSERELAQVDGVLMRQVIAWKLAGLPLTRGALRELNRLSRGKGVTAEEYAAMIAASMAPVP